MYEDYWGLSRPAFPAVIRPEAFVRTRPHQAALLKLRYVLEAGLGAGCLLGEVGSGKTTVARQLCEELSEGFGPFVHVVFPRLTTAELLGWMTAELGEGDQPAPDDSNGIRRVLRALCERLEELTAAGRHAVLLIDEAHLLEDSRLLEALTLLLNFRSPPTIDFTLILLGQPSLAGLLVRVPQLADRIGLTARLRPLSFEETDEYITARLQSSGATRVPFSAEAIAAIHAVSGGLPRMIHRLCDLALLVGYADGLEEIDAGHVHDVSLELPQAVAV